MRTTAVVVGLAASLVAGSQQSLRDSAPARSARLEELTWIEAEQALRPEAVVLVPLGAASVQHGPHLTLRNDAVLARHLTDRVAAATPVVVAPVLAYHHYPAFTEYPGSTSLSLDTARDLTADVIRGLARSGPRRFYVLNTAYTTNPALAAAAQILAREGILMRYTDPASHLAPVARSIQRQDGGNHADEMETSMMLHVDAGLVDMSKAVRDYAPASTPFALTRRDRARGTYSPSGVWGDPRFATRDKGRALVDALVAGILEDIAALRSAIPPSPSEPEASRPAGARSLPGAGAAGPPDQCSAGDERAIRAIGTAFTAHWANADAEHLASLWAEGGDMAHPDGFVERTARNIMINRADLFRRREFRLSRHPLQIGVIRCLANDIAVADGKWELRDVTDTGGKILPAMKGLLTLVVKRSGGAWLIEAYRYSIDAPPRAPVPTLLKRPGYPGGGLPD